jgi:spore germination protein YaaH
VRGHHRGHAAGTESQEELQNDAKLIIPIRPGARGDTMAFSKRPTYYAVRRGDTAISVADDYGVPADKLKKWNHLKGDTLVVGRRMVIYRPVAGGGEAATPKAPAGKKKSSSAAKKAPASGAKSAPAKKKPVSAKSKSSNTLAAPSKKKPKPAAKPQ